MEQLNRIELRGNVGSIKIQNFQDNRMAKIYLATSYAFRDKNGSAVIETTWHNVVAWENDKMPNFDYVSKGTKLYVVGRLRSQHYTTAEGEERTANEIVASRMAVITNDEPLQCEM